MEEAVRARFRVLGRVQGVGFRYFTMRLASELGVTGTVRNCADGSVEVEAEGSVALLNGFEARLRRGPVGSRVDEISSDKIALLGSRDFRIVS